MDVPGKPIWLFSDNQLIFKLFNTNKPKYIHDEEECMACIVDLSKSVEYNKGDPFFMRVKIKHKRHGTSRMLIIQRSDHRA